MKILFTGGSSFTGMWFIQELVSAGHSVTAIFPRKQEAYFGLRKDRIESITSEIDAVYSVAFGSSEFIDLIESNEWDLLCHHAADVTNYKSASFDVISALENNTKNLRNVLKALKKQKCHKVLLTGSVFEQHEGSGTEELRAVSPYGLSKGLTAEIFRFFCEQEGLSFGKFVIPNPFGPFEEPRFTTYLIKSWLEGRVPEVSTPDSIRDNIHVALLAKMYRFCAESMNDTTGYIKWNPSGYQESQGVFAQRFAFEMESRFSVPCPLILQTQINFSEPKIRINTNDIDPKMFKLNEESAWDQLAQFYTNYYGK